MNYSLQMIETKKCVDLHTVAQPRENHLCNRVNPQSAGKSTQPEAPQARAALDSMKYEIAKELGINFKQGYNGDLSSRDNGYVGGYMVKRLIEQAERQMASQGGNTMR